MAEVRQQVPRGAAPAPSAANTGGATQNRVYTQIEETADYYEPSIYSVLTFFRATELDQTILDGQFVPLTPTAYKQGDSKQNGLMFVVGLLPPTSNISGRLLDRSGTVGQILGTGTQTDLGPEEPSGKGNDGSYGSYIVTAPGYTIPVGTGTSNLGIPVPTGRSDCGGSVAISVDPNDSNKRIYNCVTVLSMQQMYQGLHDAYVRRFGHEPTPTEIQFLTAQCWRETSGYLPANNPGYIGNHEFRPGDPSNFGFEDKPGQVRGFHAYPNTEAGFDDYVRIQARNPNVLAAARQGDVLGYLTSLAQTGYFQESLHKYYNNNGSGNGFPSLLTQVANAVPQAGLGGGNDLPKDVPDSCAFKETVFEYQERVKSRIRGLKEGNPARAFRFNVDSPYGEDCPLGGVAPVTGDGTTGTWATEGSKQANTNRKEEEKLSPIQAERIRFNQALLSAQANYIQAAQVALETMRNMPPLRMLVNPSQFSVQCEKVISDGNRSRDGFIIEHWGDGQDKIEGSGTVSGFYAVDINDARSPGLGRTSRTWSASFQNFLSLWLLYRNNGGMWLPANRDDAWQAYLSVVGSIYIYYDGVLYLGSFDSFDLTETDDKPHTLEYSFSFTVRAWFLLDRQDDSNYGNGSEALFRMPPGTPVTRNT
jgi:hypothetical protein